MLLIREVLDETQHHRSCQSHFIVIIIVNVIIVIIIVKVIDIIIHFTASVGVP